MPVASKGAAGVFSLAGRAMRQTEYRSQKIGRERL
jgi:hypothetical protein